MHIASRMTGIVAAAALWLPYATPALCTTLAPQQVSDHQACEQESAQASVGPPSDGGTCDLDRCPTAPTAPPETHLPDLVVFPAFALDQPGPAETLVGQALAPPTPPPLL